MASIKDNNLHFFKYPGNKFKLLDKILPHVNELSCDVYFEPFLGSGSIFLNISQHFNKKIVSDINKNIIQIFKSFLSSDINDINTLYNEYCKYGNPGKDKEAYYKIRNEMNEKYFNSSSKEEGLFYYFIIQSCINSMARFGKKGFNQAWGNRGRSNDVTEEFLNLFKDRFKNTTILNEDFFNIFDTYDDPKTLMFLDPPYIEALIKCYEVSEFFNKELFLKKIKDSKSKIIYTDVYNLDIVNYLEWDVIELREMKSINPRNKEKGGGQITGKEIIHKNF